MTKPSPLWEKMYFRDAYTELTRAIGYDGLSIPEAGKKMTALIAKYGKDIMAQAAGELVQVDTQATPPMATLTDQARKLAWQLLGPPTAKKQGKRSKAKTTTRIENEPSESSAAETEAKEDMAVPAGTILRYYREAKERHPGMLLLFRMGDFYELYEEDAEAGAKLLGLTLTTRDKQTTMAGFPHHCLEAYLRKLLHAGQRVAVCDQVEGQAAKTRGEITRVITPGDKQRDGGE